MPTTMPIRSVRPIPEMFREHYWPMVRSLAVACGDREAAADAVQDAFTRAFVRWRRISRYEQPAGWIRHVALNRLRDHFRHEARGEKVRERLQGEATMVEPAPEVADESLATAIAGLPRQQRIAVSLFYVEQLPVREIAAEVVEVRQSNTRTRAGVAARVGSRWRW
jgi:RNA polymerase sigma-70 factor (ECF subfamily)